MQRLGASDRRACDTEGACPGCVGHRATAGHAISRSAGGSLTVQDTVRFASPQSFETALITLGSWRRAGDALIVSDGAAVVRIGVAVAGGDFDIHEEIIRENMRTPVPPKRIAVVLHQPVIAAQVTLTITPER